MWVPPPWVVPTGASSSPTFDPLRLSFRSPLPPAVRTSAAQPSLTLPRTSGTYLLWRSLPFARGDILWLSPATTYTSLSRTVLLIPRVDIFFLYVDSCNP